MSRSVSAPSSVTNTSPCWNGLIVPGSTLMYGSNFWHCTFRPRALSSRPREAATIPFPQRRDDASGYEDVLRRPRHACRPARSSSRRTGVRSIRSPSQQSPRRVSPASAPIATARPRPVSRPTDFDPAARPDCSSPRPRASPSRGDRKEAAGRPGPSARRRERRPRYALSARPGAVSSWFSALAARPVRTAPESRLVRQKANQRDGHELEDAGGRARARDGGGSLAPGRSTGHRRARPRRRRLRAAPRRRRPSRRSGGGDHGG